MSSSSTTRSPFRLAARAVVEMSDGFEVAGEAEIGEASVEAARDLLPDLVLTAIGDAVNVAARLQREADAGEILATAATVAAAQGVQAEPVGARLVKGRTEPVEVHRILG